MKKCFGLYLLLICINSHFASGQALSLNDWKLKLYDEAYEKAKIILGKPDIQLETYTNRFIYCLIYKNRVLGKSGKKNLVLFVLSAENRRPYVHSVYELGKNKPVYTPNGLHYVAQESNGNFTSNNVDFYNQLNKLKRSLKEKSISNNNKIIKGVRIGTQIWSSKNLNVSNFRNGDPIPEAGTQEEWKIADANKQPAWCYYLDDISNGEKYGKLYNWYAVNDPRGLAPFDWHIPSNDEWITMNLFLEKKKSLHGLRYNFAKEIKSKNSWKNSDNNIECAGTNKSGFSALPGGRRRANGYCDEIDYYGYWWSSTKRSSGETEVAERATTWDLSNDCYIRNTSSSFGCGYSIRCIRDTSKITSSSKNIVLGKYYYKCKGKKLGKDFYIDLLPNNKFKAYYEECEIYEFFIGSYYFDPQNSTVRFTSKNFPKDNILEYKNKTLIPKEDFFYLNCTACDNGIYVKD